MKNIASILIVLSFILAAVSCAEKPKRPESVSPTELVMNPAGDEQMLTVVGFSPSMEVEYPDEGEEGFYYWLNCNFVEGSGDEETYSVTAEYNDTEKTREAVIIFSFFEGKTIEVNVSQAPLTELIRTEPMDLVFEPEGNAIMFSVIVPEEEFGSDPYIDVNYYDYVDWLREDWYDEDFSPNGQDEFVLRATLNPGEEERTGKFIITVDGTDAAGNPKYVRMEKTVRQAADTSMFAVIPSELTFDAIGGKQNVEVIFPQNVGVDIEVETESPYWFDCEDASYETTENGRIYVAEAEFNHRDQVRTSYLTFRFHVRWDDVEVERRLTATQAADGSAVINFEDPRFLEAILNMSSYYGVVDQNGDGQITESEAASVTELRVGGSEGSKIRSMKEISYFTNLQSLRCGDNNLETLDLSSNRALTYLDCSNNLLTSLDLSQNTALTYLECSTNRLTELSLEHLSELKTLYCGGNQITSLDLKANTLLELFSCSGNLLTTLDVSGCKQMTSLHCNGSNLTSLKLNNPALVTLWCNENDLTSLDMTSLSSLESLDLRYNEISHLDLSHSPLLRELYEPSTLEYLNLSGNQGLESLTCDRNPNLKTLILANTKLVKLVCSQNALTELNLAGSADLEEIDCHDNALESLKTDGNPYIRTLNISENSFKEIDLSGNSALVTLKAEDNPLEHVVLSRSCSYLDTIMAALRALYTNLKIETR